MTGSAAPMESSLKGLSNFVNDFRHYYKRWKMNTDKRAIKTDMLKIKIQFVTDKDVEFGSVKWQKPGINLRFPRLDNGIRAYTFVVEGDKKVLAEARAMQLLLELRDFIEAYKRDFRAD